MGVLDRAQTAKRVLRDRKHFTTQLPVYGETPNNRPPINGSQYACLTRPCYLELKSKEQEGCDDTQSLSKGQS